MSQPIDERINGTWRFSEPEEAEGWNYLHFSNGNRIVQFYNINKGCFENGRMLVGDIGDNTLEFYKQDGTPGWTRAYRFEGEQLVITGKEKEFFCDRFNDLPDWLKKGIAEANDYFDELEADWGK